jgi:predicted TIM-barrel fold metal-dependent hydrolase
LTADRAAIAEKLAAGMRVFGGLALNEQVGGLNPAAVEAAIRLGAREIWMPTSSAAHHIAYYRRKDPGHVKAHYRGITVLRRDDRLKAEVEEILRLIAAADIILGTGHLSPKEVMALVPAARAAGVLRIIVTHPELAISNIPLAMQKALALPGVWFERCFVATVFLEPTPLEAFAEGIRALGPERTILSSDLGDASKPPPIAGWRSYLSGLLKLGVSWRDLERMTKQNPAELVDL